MTIAIYTKDDAGQLTRSVLAMSREQFLAALREQALECGVPAELADPFELGSVDRLLGWPETAVEWYGNDQKIGIGR